MLYGTPATSRPAEQRLCWQKGELALHSQINGMHLSQPCHSQTFHVFLYGLYKVLDAEWKVPRVFLDADLNLIPAANCGFFFLLKFCRTREVSVHLTTEQDRRS